MVRFLVQNTAAKQVPNLLWMNMGSIGPFTSAKAAYKAVRRRNFEFMVLVRKDRVTGKRMPKIVPIAVIALHIVGIFVHWPEGSSGPTNARGADRCALLEADRRARLGGRSLKDASRGADYLPLSTTLSLSLSLSRLSIPSPSPCPSRHAGRATQSTCSPANMLNMLQNM